ncbi:MAG: TM2 domain-containing protein [Bacteroidales bacterium]|nr:TM2 domain-containing protein [Bacteroidales bacterium]
MDKQHMFMMLPGLQAEELMFIQSITKDMTETQQQHFITLYQNKRKDQQTLMIMTLVGFVGIAGIQRFVVGEPGMGILFLLTVGFCGIGTIIDLVNIKSIALNFNQKQAIEAANMVKMMSA